jgi:hypothetical protein
MVDDRKPCDAGATAQVDDMAALARLHREQEMGDLRALLAMPEGRRFLRRLLIATGPLASGYTGDPSTTAFKQGVRWAGLWVLRESMEADAVAAASLLAEYAVTEGVMNV